MTVRVMVHATIEEEHREPFEEAYRRVTETVRGTPGHIRDQLIRNTENPCEYIVLAEWENEEAFRRWEDDPVHREMAAPMYPYWAGGGIVRKIFDVRATLESRPG